MTHWWMKDLVNASLMNKGFSRWLTYEWWIRWMTHIWMKDLMNDSLMYKRSTECNSQVCMVQVYLPGGQGSAVSVGRLLVCLRRLCKHKHMYVTLKELEHRKLGWKELIFKYDLSKSLSKEMRWNMADTKEILDYIFKKMKNACNMR